MSAEPYEPAPWDVELPLDELHAADPPPPALDDPAPAVTPEAVDADRVEAEDHAADLDLLTRPDLLRLSDPDALRTITGALRAELLRRVRAIAAEAAEQRPEARKATVSTIAPEILALADAHDVLTGLGDALRDARSEAAALALEAVHDVLGEHRRSAKVADLHGFEVSVSAIPRTETSVDEQAVADVVVGHLIAARDGDDDAPTEPTAAYARGVRDGWAALRDLLSASPGWKVTALAGLVKGLQARGEHDLAARLDAAFARVDKGEPSPKIERKG